MERARPLPDRRRILKGAALAAVPYALLPDARAGAQTQTVDYPLAQWQPATASNYTTANRPSDHPVDRVVIHVTQTAYAKALAVFQNPRKKVSAHYVVRSADGHVAQCVRESDIAWHAGNWDYNTRSIGIEHEGWVDQPAYFTDALYARSARLTASVCERYGIAKDRAHIIGHYEVPGTDHTDPGHDWDWDRYMRLVDFG
ncbi:N-acetylmuramoyl-L-alanine amidase [Streptomyces sp. NBC_01275]|uniref:N-acetylmuramoyl-L-alanine amidase n=1 Tax=Streptomyces sp. NBC_01275 TaxID=2903807 RepID=UPI00224D0B84|nr:N-acetylmuramoyl-L-alanine amidase [Streptomyces sp. NBC_01275]MCX4759996.1 N-acetylmuramoyl-L-alanine amidase [Streptomyces sp. NBC_01275]